MRPFYPFKDSQIRDYTAGVEVLEATEDDMIAIILDDLVVIAWIDGATDEVIVLNDQLLRALILVVRAHDGRSP